MTIAFRVLFLVIFGGLVLLWYLDFEPRRLTAFVAPALQGPGRDDGTSGPDMSGELNRRLEAIEAAVSTLAAALPPPVDLDPLDRRLAALGSQLDVIESRLSRRAVDGPRAPVIADLERRLSALAEQVEAIEARAPAQPDLSELETRLAGIERLLSRAPDESSGPDLTWLSGKIEEISARIDDLADSPRVAGRLNDLVAKVEAVEAQLADLASRPRESHEAAAGAALSEIAARLDEIAEQPDRAALPETLDKRLAAIEAGIDARLQALEAKITALSALPRPEIDTSGIEARIEALTNRQQLAPDIATLREAVSDVGSQLEGLTLRLAEADVPDDLAERVASIEAKLEGLPRALQATLQPFEMADRLRGLEAVIAELTERAAAAPDTRALESVLANLETNLSARLEALESELADISGRPGADAVAGVVGTQVAEIAARIGGIEGRLAAADPSALDRQLATMEARLDEIAADMAGTLDTAAFEAQLDAMESRLASLAEMLEERPGPQPANETSAAAAPTQSAALAVPEVGTTILTIGEAWMRIRDGNRTIFEGLVPAGERVPVPRVLRAPELRAGNAGSVYVVVDGVPYGPLGEPREVVRDVSLQPADIRERFPRAAAGALVDQGGG